MTTPMAERVSAPAPEDNKSGIAPAAVVKPVMIIGRNRVIEASLIASSNGVPSSLN